MNPQKSDYVSRVRDAATEFILAINKLRALRRQGDALDLGSSLVPEDFGAEDLGISPADVFAVTGTTLDAIESLLAQGHATNLYKIAR